MAHPRVFKKFSHRVDRTFVRGSLRVRAVKNSPRPIQLDPESRPRTFGHLGTQGGKKTFDIVPRNAGIYRVPEQQFQSLSVL